MNDSIEQTRHAGTNFDLVNAVQSILAEEIALAKPDDLAFLEFQVPRIARRIARLLGSPDDPQEWTGTLDPNRRYGCCAR